MWKGRKAYVYCREVVLGKEGRKEKRKGPAMEGGEIHLGTHSRIWGDWEGVGWLTWEEEE